MRAQLTDADRMVPHAARRSGRPLGHGPGPAMTPETPDRSAATDLARRILQKGSRAHWWRRRGSKRTGYRYEDENGNPITDDGALARIRRLAIPPGYTEVR